MLRIALETVVHRALLEAREVARLGTRPWYWRLRLALAREEWLQPAWRVAAREGPDTGLSPEDLTYGETPLLTAWELLRELRVGPQDRVVDLGCGRGQVLHLACLACGCRGWGVDALSGLVTRAQRVAERLQLNGLEFVSGDFRALTLPPGSLYFLQPTTLTDSSWQALAGQLQQVPAGARAVSLSVPIPHWKVLTRSQRAYSWGWCTVFVQEKA